MIGIELKQSRSVQGLKRMLEDIVKIRALRGSDWPFRELYFVLFYYEDLINRWKYGALLNDLLNNEKIGSEILEFPNQDKLRCLIVYWESGPHQTQMAIDSYLNWYTEIEHLMEKYELTNIAKGRAKGR